MVDGNDLDSIPIEVKARPGWRQSGDRFHVKQGEARHPSDEIRVGID
jgi:hypothetical protein